MLAAFLLLAATPEEPPFGFSGMDMYLAHGEAKALTAADFNGDGLTDFALLNPGRSRVDLYLQKTAERYAADLAEPASFDEVNQIHDDARFDKESIPLDRLAFSMTAGDFDGDGAPEVAVVSDPAHVALYRRTDGSWRRAWQIELESRGRAPYPRSIAAADFNGDGARDLAVLRANGVAIFHGEDGGFSPVVELLTTLEAPEALFTPDLDGDGRADLALFKAGQDTGLTVRLQRGGALGWEYSFRTGQLRDVSFADVDGAAGDEILSIHGTTGRLIAQKLTATPLEEPEYREPIALVGIERRREERGFVVGDVNGDGRNDLLISDPERATIDVFLQSEAGVLLAPRSFSTFAGVRDLSILDGAVYVASASEQAVGVSRWDGTSLAFPEGLPTTGTPRCLVVSDFGLAYATEVDRAWKLVIGETVVDLPRLPEGPARLLACDLDSDGDTDIVITQSRDPFVIARNQGDGWQVLDSDAYGGRGLLGGAAEGSFIVTGAGLMFGKQNFARLAALDADGRLSITEQIAGRPGSTITAAARAASGEVFLYNSARGEQTLHLMVNEDGTWREAASIAAAAIAPQRVAIADISGDGLDDLLMLGAGAVGVLARSRESIELSTAWSYESEEREAMLIRASAGDVNMDGAPDLVVYDYRNRSMEILTLAGEPRRAIAFEVAAEEGQRMPPLLREMVVRDLTGDGKNDILVLIEDRAILYVGE